MKIKNNVMDYLRKLYASCVWTHKIQEKESERLRNIDSALKIVNIFVLALSSSGLFSIIFMDNFILKLATTILSFIGLATSLFSMGTDYKERANKHKDSALDFLELRNDIEACLSDIDIDRFLEEELLEKKDFFETKYSDLCRKSSSASKIAVKRASKALKVYKDNSYTEDEIDEFLPIHLRKANEDKRVV